MATPLRGFVALLAALLLLGHTSYAQDDGDEEGGYDGDGDGYGGDGGGDGDGDGDEVPPGGGGGGLKELTSVEDFEKFIDNTDASVIGCFKGEKLLDPKAVRPHDWDDEEDGEWEAPTIDNPAFASYKTISQSEYGYRYAYSTSPAVLERLKSTHGGLYLYRSPYWVSKEHGDRARERFPSDTLTESSVSHWLATKAQTLVGEFSSSTQDRYKSPLLIIFMDLDFEKNNKSTNYVIKRARKVAAGMKDKLAIAVASISGMSYELSDYGLESKSTSDILMGIRAGSDYSDAKYGAPADKAFSGDSLASFANAYLAGELTPVKKAEGDDDGTATTPPDDDDEGTPKDEM